MSSSGSLPPPQPGIVQTVIFAILGAGLGYLALQNYDDIEDYLLFSDFKFGKAKNKIKAITTIIFFSIMINLILNSIRFILTNLLNKKHDQGLALNLSRLIQSHLQNLAIFIGIYAYIIHQSSPFENIVDFNKQQLIVFANMFIAAQLFQVLGTITNIKFLTIFCHLGIGLSLVVNGVMIGQIFGIYPMAYVQ